jgi:SpoVK/Ycf46/Vps4 family AAA+-type ATPase
MDEYRITYSRNGAARSRTYTAESEGEAIELFEEWADAQDDDIEFVGCVKT